MNKEKKEFTFKILRKVITWAEDTYSIPADSYEEAAKIAITQMDDHDDEIFIERMIPSGDTYDFPLEDNDGSPTVIVYYEDNSLEENEIANNAERSLC